MCVDANAGLDSPGRLQTDETHLRTDAWQNEEVFNSFRHVSVELSS
jgi:hypothetical protein